MKKLISCIATIFVFNVYGQINLGSQLSPPNPNWKMPANVEGICKNIEVSLIQLIKIENDNFKIFLNTQMTDAQRNDAWTAVDGSKRTQRIEEERWSKLGCIHYYKKL